MRHIASTLPSAAALVAALAVLMAASCAPAGEPNSAERPEPTSPPSRPVASSSATTATSAAVDTSTWTTYASDQYDFKVGRPPDWKEMPATRAWSPDTDAEHPASTAFDTFRSPSDNVRVSVWSVPLDKGTSINSLDELGAWAEDHCAETNNSPCGGIQDRAVELCIEVRDCHPGLLVRFRNDVQAYFSGGLYDDKAVTVAAVWRGESAPAVAEYGGAQRLLAAFLSTMQVWPASTPLSERTCYGRKPVDLVCPERG